MEQATGHASVQFQSQALKRSIRNNRLRRVVVDADSNFNIGIVQTIKHETQITPFFFLAFLRPNFSSSPNSIFDVTKLGKTRTLTYTVGESKIMVNHGLFFCLVSQCNDNCTQKFKQAKADQRWVQVVLSRDSNPRQQKCRQRLIRWTSPYTAMIVLYQNLLNYTYNTIL